jgi:hypothetical protein
LCGRWADAHVSTRAKPPAFTGIFLPSAPLSAARCNGVFPCEQKEHPAQQKRQTSDRACIRYVISLHGLRRICPRSSEACGAADSALDSFTVIQGARASLRACVGHVTAVRNSIPHFQVQQKKEHQAMIRTLLTLVAATMCALLIACDGSSTSSPPKPERAAPPPEKPPGMDFQDASKAEGSSGAAPGRGTSGSGSGG